MEDAKYTELQRNIAPGQIIVMATDGIWEARGPDDDMFGKDRLYSIIRQNASASANEIQHAIFEALKHFRKDAKLEDDMTSVVVKIDKFIDILNRA
jgi:sigma-B regulation protein RsbU (phosphoserine phosphatase)